MLELLPIMLELFGILVILALLLSRMKSFQQIIHNEHSMKVKFLLIVIFGALDVVSNYTGVHIIKIPL